MNSNDVRYWRLLTCEACVCVNMSSGAQFTWGLHGASVAGTANGRECGGTRCGCGGCSYEVSEVSMNGRHRRSRPDRARTHGESFFSLSSRITVTAPEQRGPMRNGFGVVELEAGDAVVTS